MESTINLERIDKAFEAIDRSDFVPEDLKEEAWLDIPLPIGFGQTISQPSTVMYMLEWLDLPKGAKVLDVGSGSGWTTALLSYLVGQKGHVYAVEKIHDLLEFGDSNCSKVGIKNVSFCPAKEEVVGLPEYGPYDRILVSAASSEMPEELIYQLAIGGKLVVPVRDSILEITKDTDLGYSAITHHGFAFVPLEK